MSGIPGFEVDKPLFTLVCGCTGYIKWSMDLTWEVEVISCAGHVPILELPEGTIRVN